MLRLLRHLLTPFWMVRLRYPQELLTRIATRVAEVERRHPGEVRFAVEHALDLPDLIAGVTPRERALEVFSQLRVWDTEHNNGVLIYLLLAEHAIEVVADRGLRAHDAAWPPMVAQLRAALQAGRFEEGLNGAVDAAGGLLQREFPRQADEADRPGGNELPNEVVVL